MTLVLCAAGIYNLVWGAWVVFFIGFVPLGRHSTQQLPEIWQCLGMVVGVYGIGYLIAARDPLRHWPSILVGLIGKTPWSSWDVVVRS
jgi:small multidrug resistance pump